MKAKQRAEIETPNRQIKIAASLLRHLLTVTMRVPWSCRHHIVCFRHYACGYYEIFLA